MRVKNPSQFGHSTVEILVAAFILASALVAVLMIVWQQLALALSGEMFQKATQKAMTALIEGQTVLRSNFEASIDKNETDGIFALSLNKDFLSPQAEKVMSKVSWQDAFYGQREIEMSGNVWDLSHMGGADTCGLGFSGSWISANTLGSYYADPANPIIDADVDDKKIYVATNSSASSLEDFFILDASDQLNPQKLSTSVLNTGPGLAALQKSGDYIFAANDGTAQQLHIIKVLNPEAPTLVLKLRVPNFNGLQSDGTGSSVLVYGTKLFLGLTKNNGPELHIYDVSNPEAPLWLGYFETNSAVNAMTAFRGRLYLSVASGDQLVILDISDAHHPVKIDSFPTPGSLSQSGQSVAVLGSRVFLGRAGGLPASGIKELYEFSTSDFHNQTAEADLNTSVKDMFIRGGYLFLATGDDAAELKIYTLENLSFVGSADLVGDAVALDCEGDKFFVSSFKSSEPKKSELQIFGPGN